MQSFEMFHTPTQTLVTVFLTPQEIHGGVDEDYTVTAYQDLDGQIIPIVTKLSDLRLLEDDELPDTIRGK